ncbi:hypothetical protein ABH922_000062 [Rhodococcus sp. 27YEA15]|uniref:hypothetical protein n=1 Tax=Rhodococcus sp. 27YEA15 TaxID=3156259 RepID=UPI003C7EB46A
MINGRRADTSRRIQPVLTTLEAAVADGTQLGVAGIARVAGVDRTFLYRHKCLPAQICTAQAAPTTNAEEFGCGKTGIVARGPRRRTQRITRFAAHNALLERKLAELLGQQVVDLTGRLEERDQELDEARTADSSPI